jgi:hypothetical protein
LWDDLYMNPRKRAADFNARVKVGGVVLFGPRDQRRTTRAAAQVLADGRAVVWLDAMVGAVDLDLVEPA